MFENEFILTLSCQDRIGIVAAVTGMLATNGMNILELSQFSDPSTQQFFMRLDFRVESGPSSEDQICEAFKPVAEKFGMSFELHDKNYRPKVLIMVSKLSHCFNDLLHRHKNGTLPIEIPAVVSNHEDLEEMASWYNLPFYHFPITQKNKIEQEKKLFKLVQDLEIDLIVLARYMQIISEDLCKKLHGKIININHSFLPSFKGAKPYHQAYERGVKVIGATAHYVTADLDEGPIIDQETIRVRHDHTPKQLVQLGCDVECLVLARALKYQVEQRVILNNNKTVVFS
ncbi:MAG: formyltetrahydrofolate deformylase [Simkania sp.]|nr:formyltetrahydrofolate deformylase [Simkania sp.]